MNILPGNATYQGKRPEQQDSFGFTRFDDRTFGAHAGVMAIVADGMGGFFNGAAASREAVAAMRSAYERKEKWESIPDALLRSLGRANMAVRNLASDIDKAGYVGTTLVAAVVFEDSLYWISVGDSRLYLFRDECLHRLTVDHTKERELMQQVDAGVLAEEDMMRDPERKALVSYVGLEHLDIIDRNETGYRLQPRDKLVLCSDGLYNALSEDEIAAALQGEPQVAAQALVHFAIDKDRPTQDNVTVIVLGLEETKGGLLDRLKRVFMPGPGS